MANKTTAPTRMRLALACVLAVFLALSMEHHHSGFAFAGHHPAATSGSPHGHPGDHNHQISIGFTACPSPPCFCLVAAATDALNRSILGAVVFSIVTRPLHSALVAGPLRPPNADPGATRV